MTTQDKATSRAESGEAVEVLLDGFRLVKESALDRLRMDDEIVSIVDYHANKARALLASRPVESAKTVPMEMLQELYFAWMHALANESATDVCLRIIARHGYTVTESGKEGS